MEVDTTDAGAGAGGFLPYSPPPSSVTSSRATSALPHPRSSPLKPGGSKESNFIRHVDQQLLHIQRRFAKRDEILRTDGTQTDKDARAVIEAATSKPLPKSERWHDVPGFKNFAEAARDVEALLEVIWISGTPSLQIPYLIALALLTTTMIPSFPASPRQLFRLIGKLDHAFASLLRGHDLDSGEPLPGFEYGRKVSVTEKVRIKSLVERTRVSVANLMAAGDIEEDDIDDVNDDDTENVDELDGDLVLDAEDDIRDPISNDWSMNVAKVYDETLLQIGSSMEGPAIGIYTGV